MSNGLLTGVLLPPKHPIELPPPGGWDRIENSFIQLPDDYKWFIDTYGSGSICDGYMVVFNPFSANQYLNLFEQARVIANAFAILRRDYPEEFGLDFYPSPGGLLPFGMNIDGTYFAWSTEGPPNSWTVCVLGHSPLNPQPFWTGFGTWLHGILTGQLRCRHLAGDLLDGPINFVPTDRPS